MPQLWEVLGGVGKGGIIVRSGQSLSSPQLSTRLSTGASVEELELAGERLHYRRLVGSGPDEGWISICLQGKVLARRAEDAFQGTWEDDDGTEVVIDGATMRGLGTTAAFSIIGLFMCSFQISEEVFSGRLMSDGRLVWSDGAVWKRNKSAEAAVVCSTSQTFQPAGRATEHDYSSPPLAAKVPKAKKDLPTRGADGRRPLPDCQLSPMETVEWIRDAVDVFETMMLPLEAISETRARAQYKQLLLLVHPDKNRNPGSTEAFRKLFDALAVVMDPLAQQQALRRSLQHRDNKTSGGKASGRQVPSDNRNPGFGFFDEDGGIFDMLFSTHNANADEAERRLHKQSDRLEASGDVDASDRAWIDPENAWQLLQDDKVIFIDVRDYDEFLTSNIDGSLSIPWSIAASASHSDEFLTILAEPEKMVVVYSDNGSQLSRCGQVAFFFGLNEQVGKGRVRRLRKGLNGWKRLGFPVEGSRNAFFARQRLGGTLGQLSEEAENHTAAELTEGQKWDQARLK